MDTRPPSPDPILLDVPPDSSNSPPIPAHPVTSMVVDPPAKTEYPEPTFYIEIPRPPAFERELYESVPNSFKDGMNFGRDDIEAVVGEWRGGGPLYYYVRFVDGLAHKVSQMLLFLSRQLTLVQFPARAFETQYADLVAEYKRKKIHGSLHPFDPSSSVILEHSFIERAVTTNGSSSAMSTSTGSTMTEDSLSEDTDQNDDSDYVRAPQRRRTARSGGAVKQSKLPFSPKKFRNRHPRERVDEESDDELGVYGQSDIEVVSRRRSTRTRRAARSHFDDFVEDDGEDYTDNSDYKAAMSDAEEDQKQRRPVAARPAYGHFRHIVNLDLDPYDEEATEALRAHRGVCEKCHKKPAHNLLKAIQRSKKGKRRRADGMDLDLEEDEEEQIQNLGGWVRCLKCPVAAHWGCLAKTQRDEIIRAARSRDEEESLAMQEQGSPLAPNGLPERKTLAIDETTEFICGSCMKGGICMYCNECAVESDVSASRQQPVRNSTAVLHEEYTSEQVIPAAIDGTSHDIPTISADVSKPPRELTFRCVSCKRLAHYRHMPDPRDATSFQSDAERAHYYQTENSWQCADCASFIYPLDKILAWRPYPPDAVEPTLPDYSPDIRAALPREYLVKWAGRSYRRVQWVPHMWLAATYFMKLKNFLATGPRVELLRDPVTDSNVDADQSGSGAQSSTSQPKIDSLSNSRRRARSENSSSEPLKDALLRIPPAWKTVDRILDVQLWHPPASPTKGRSRRRLAMDSGDEADALPRALQVQRDRAFEDGEQPDDELLESVDEWQSRTKKKLRLEHIDQVIWAFIKWDDLGYDEATWDSPPRLGEPGYSAYEAAFQAFLESRTVSLRKTQKEIAQFSNRSSRDYHKYAVDPAKEEQPDLGQDTKLKLMKFQIEGLDWLCYNWWIHQPCILADEMGLGKTVQIVMFLGTVIEKFKAAPALVVVPNSTITNWVREFSRWAPRLRVVPFYGEAKSREVVLKYELFHGSTTKAPLKPKYHVLVTTYETITGHRDFTVVFKNIPQWEVLVVDEGQRLKSDTSLLFRKLNELNILHRVIMTGTPLNNNIRELFNLMNFLDPDQWKDLEGLSKEYEILDEDLVRQLHTRLKPYFLRRIKSEVLQLPPKNEVIVPVSMAPLQKEIYRSILSQNLSILKGLTQSSSATSHGRALGTRTNMSNILMQLRKCLQHPYLISDTIEPRDLTPVEAHERLIGASAKLRLLRSLLPKLKARGHRVLLFSQVGSTVILAQHYLTLPQFVIALNIVEDFLTGEGYKFLRLDGETKQSVRQKGMDEFNKPNSETFIYLLTTRAGGVGINLYTADTVIIFDPDFNPHQDFRQLLAVIGMVKRKLASSSNSWSKLPRKAGKKKLVLDHLIVQKMDDDENGGDDLQSILTFGAKALFEEGDQNSQDIACKYIFTSILLIEKTEAEEGEKDIAKESGLKFNFAKVWAADKDTFEEIGDATPDPAEDDSWTRTLERIAAEKGAAEEQEMMGRGVSLINPFEFQQQLDFIEDLDDSPRKSKSKSKKKQRASKSTSSDSDVYAASPPADDTDSSAGYMNAVDLSVKRNKRRYRETDIPPGNQSLFTIRDSDSIQRCGLCDNIHGPGECEMMNDPRNLVEYREILMYSNDEPVEIRAAAIRAIEQELHDRGQWHLLVAQPQRQVEYPIPMRTSIPDPRPKHGGQIARRDNRYYQASRPSLPVVPTSTPVNDAIPGMPEPQVQLMAVTKIRREDKRNAVSLSKESNISPGPLSSSVLPAKRRTSPLPQERTSKKHKQMVAEGAGSISKQILRFSDDPSHARTVKILKRILKKQRQQTELGSAPPADSMTY
ncbi:hypothetical protein ID866_7805 [Astraeus odoratus]|nr:hypothetical protein ID866_7805 [Astraeus odoratus]